MSTVIGLSYIAALPVMTAVILHLLDRRTAFGKLSNRAKQIIYGLVFGGLAVIGTEFGVDVGGAAANTRDASVLTAGLVFGAPAGIMAGLIGGVERYLAVYWGAGEYTRLACTLSTIICGVLGAALRIHLFNDKRPPALYALAIGLVGEVMHMLMVFITNMSDIETAFIFVRKCSIPMITVNSAAVMLSVLLVSLPEKEKGSGKKSGSISAIAQRRLLYSVVTAFILTCAFTFILQFRISDNSTNSLLRLNIDDVIAEVTTASDRNLINLAHRVRAELADSDDLSAIAKKYGVSEINMINAEGIISDSTVDLPGYIGYDMASGEQSAEFMTLLNGADSFVQSYRPISYDSSILRKFAGVPLPGGGFVQVGYDAKKFHEDIKSEIVSAAVNRRIGRSGYIFISDENHKMISTRSDKLYTTVASDIRVEGAVREGERFTAEFYGEEAYCMYATCEGYHIIGVLPASEADTSRSLSVHTMMFMEIVIFGGLFMLIYYLVKRLVLDNISSVNSSLAEITAGNLDVTVNVRSNDEFAALSDDINATVDTLKRYIAEAAARIDKELELAKVIQESSLPSVFPPFPDRKELDIFASMDAAKEVGGDFYDFYFLDDNRLAFLVADVSGKGITAAMFMMKAKTLIKSFAERGGSAADILTKANNALCEGNEAEMFVTCFLGILDMEKGAMEFANAGHNPPLIRRSGGEFEYFRIRPGFVLGGMENIRYRNGEAELNTGDTIFLYTDGVTEATDLENRLYGDERLQRTLNNTAAANAWELCAAVKADMNVFVGEAPQFDDITMLCIRLNNTGEQDRMSEITVEASVANIGVVTEFVDAHLEALNCPMKAKTQIDIAIDELFGNIANYAYHPETGQATVRVEVGKDPLAVMITFMDGGMHFDPLKEADPDITLAAEERGIGGLGIFLVKKSMDDISYEYRDGKNILTIRKNL